MGENLAVVSRTVPSVTTITLNRPDKRNALNISLLEAFCEALDETHADPAQRVIMVRGEGPVFCAGLDLTEARIPEKAERSGRLVARALSALLESPLLTISAAQGAAVAGGAGIMLACDLAIAASDLRTGFTEVRRGLVAVLVMTFLRRKVGEAKARELLLLGHLIGAEEALEAGMVNRVVERDKLTAAAEALAREALKSGPEAIATTKKLYNDLYHIPVSEHIAYAQQLHHEMRTTTEAEEGLAAYAEKRPPAWDPESDTPC